MITLTTWEESQELIKPVRSQVFVIEQSIPESDEWDDDDARAIHALATLDDQVVGTGRLIIHGSQAKMGRMAVLEEKRSQGLGRAILQALIQAGVDIGINNFILHAQVHAMPLYASEGFTSVGEPFDEVGIPHQMMQLIK
ncbi:MAG: GNAT family N-acetyltransferase [Polynucleobacter sp.]|nr:MAG: GNAT family N-acetyltransferase [Polynucleobacter sp.]